MNGKNVLLLLTFVVFLISCSEDRQLQKSIFVNDSTAPGLPEYSELGFNTFGAYYDREDFISSATVPMKVIVADGKTAISFIGRKGSSGEVSIIIKREDFLPATYADLLPLGNTSLALNEEGVKVSIKKSSTEYDAQILSGKITFKKAQNLLVDKKQVGVILSGVFELQAIVDGEPVSITEGRFDVSVGEENFFNY